MSDVKLSLVNQSDAEIDKFPVKTSGHNWNFILLLNEIFCHHYSDAIYETMVIDNHTWQSSWDIYDEIVYTTSEHFCFLSECPNMQNQKQ